MNRRFLIIPCLFACLSLSAQRMEKFSPTVRRIVRERVDRQAAKPMKLEKTVNSSQHRDPELMALVRCSAPEALSSENCRTWGKWGDIYAASIPLSHLSSLSQRPEVKRIEAGRPCQISVDTTATLLGVRDIWPGIGHPDGLTGRGVVMGIQDIGFDLTHPTFYSRDLKEYRIKAFWDMLDTDTVGSTLYVGRDYTDQTSLLKKARATDGLLQTHGVHTAGIAAGSGFDSPYSGMAPEADLCFVANAVSNDLHLIAEEDRYKYTTATDVMGFQYIFDYATSQGKPCVISFSEGAHEDLYGDSQLLYEVLAQMTGPGRIIVASAGNSSVNKTYLHKPVGKPENSSFIYANGNAAFYTIRHSAPTATDICFSLNETADVSIFTRTVTTAEILSCPDSLLVDTLRVEDEEYLLLMASYPSCYNPDEWATELYLQTLTQKYLGMANQQRVRLVLKGEDADVECFASGGLFLDISAFPQYMNAEATHNINFPAAAPAVIAVGGTAYRTGAFNRNGKWKGYDMGDDGRRWAYSSVGPTMQGTTKPDVMAPACNIISGYSSFYIENNPKANDVDWDVSHFEFQGRTYAWNCNSGTSMSAPVVGGIVALWLQLCPSLSPQDIMEVISQTSRRYDPSLSYPNNLYGWGEIDAEAGAEYIRQHLDRFNAIDEIPAASGEDLPAVYYDLSGRRLPGKPLQPGIYIERKGKEGRKIRR